MPDVFISHSTMDKSLCDQTRQALEEAGISTWNHTSMVAGYLLAPQLRQAIHECQVCVFLATPHAIASAWCPAEAGAFWGVGKTVIIFTEDKDFDKNSLPQFSGDLRASNHQALIEAVRDHLPPRLPPPERHPAVLISLSDQKRDSEKNVAIRTALPREVSPGSPVFQEIADWKALTREQLSPWQGLLLAFPHGKRLTQGMIADLVSWVRAGGNLVVTGFELGERHHSTNINQLTWFFGIAFNSDVVVNSQHDGNAYDKQYDRPIVFTPAVHSDHPLLHGVGGITLRNVCTLHLAPGATSLVSVSPNRVLELDASVAVYTDRGDEDFMLAAGGQKFHTDPSGGERSVIAQAPIGLTGNGRVLAMGSWDLPPKSLTQNAAFLANLWRWMAGAE